MIGIFNLKYDHSMTETLNLITPWKTPFQTITGYGLCGTGKLRNPSHPASWGRRVCHHVFDTEVIIKMLLDMNEFESLFVGNDGGMKKAFDVDPGKYCAVV